MNLRSLGTKTVRRKSQSEKEEEWRRRGGERRAETLALDAEKNERLENSAVAEPSSSHAGGKDSDREEAADHEADDGDSYVYVLSFSGVRLGLEFDFGLRHPLPLVTGNRSGRPDPLPGDFLLRVGDEWLESYKEPHSVAKELVRASPRPLALTFERHATAAATLATHTGDGVASLESMTGITAPALIAAAPAAEKPGTFSRGRQSMDHLSTDDETDDGQGDGGGDDGDGDKGAPSAAGALILEAFGEDAVRHRSARASKLRSYDSTVQSSSSASSSSSRGGGSGGKRAVQSVWRGDRYDLCCDFCLMAAVGFASE